MKRALPLLHRLRRLRDEDIVEVSLYLRAKRPLPLIEELRSDRRQRRPHLQRLTLAERHGALENDMAAVDTFASRHGLKVLRAEPSRRRVVLRGRATDVERAFNTELHRARLGNRWFHVKGRAHELPLALRGAVTGVFGLDTHPVARPYFVRAPQVRPALRALALPAAPQRSFTPLELARLYNFPQEADGSGQRVALVQLDGAFSEADFNAYMKALGFPSPPGVEIQAINDAPIRSSANDFEVMLDIEIAAAIAPAAAFTLYFSQPTYRGFLDAVTAVVHDTDRRPGVLSISWGMPEDRQVDGIINDEGQDMRQEMDQAFRAAAALGITVVVASGDAGSSDGLGDGKPHVDFPASSPHVLACGGTRLDVRAGELQSEEAWNDGRGKATGGGVSTQFDRPDYQDGAKVPLRSDGAAGRGVPDVCALADQRTGYSVRYQGADHVVGGSSAAAPLWAGLIARLVQVLGEPQGMLHDKLYGQAAVQAALRDITSGNNGLYTAGPGWDPCTGLGRPDGEALLSALKTL
jgi:kumamolisin